MPIFEYKCANCDHSFELLLRSKETPECPRCGSKKLVKLMSRFNSNISGGKEALGGTCSTCSGGTCSTCGK